MHTRPVIGVPTQTLHTLPGIPGTMPASWVMSHRYIRVLASLGAVPIMIPLLDDDADALRGIYDTMDGLFIPGGADIDPASYGAERHPRCEEGDPPRDRVELSLLRLALEEKKPVFGVCRGVQLLNLAAGGSLYQDIADQFIGCIKHDYFPFDGQYQRDYLAHHVDVTGETRLGDIVGSATMPVNSMHHQGIRDLAEGLVATAYAPDGLVEAAEGSGDHFLVGVQWHPEVLIENHPANKRLFTSFLDAAVHYREARQSDVLAS